MDLLDEARDLDLGAESKERFRRREEGVYEQRVSNANYPSDDLHKLSFEEIRTLYNNVLNNTRRLELVKDWWVAPERGQR